MLSVQSSSSDAGTPEAANGPLEDGVATQQQSTSAQRVTHTTFASVAQAEDGSQGRSEVPSSERFDGTDVQGSLERTTAPFSQTVSTEYGKSHTSIAVAKSPKAEVAGMRSPPTKKPSSQTRLRNAFSNWWMWELLSILLSLLCFMGVIILIAVSDGKGVPDLGYGLTA